MLLFFDTETTGIYQFKKPPEDPSQPHIVQLAAMLVEPAAEPIVRGSINIIVNPGVDVPEGAANVHGIATKTARRFGWEPVLALGAFRKFLQTFPLVVAHNINFDLGMLKATTHRELDGAMASEFLGLLGGCKQFCTMQATTNVCKLPGRYGKYKWPKLSEAYEHFFNQPLEGAHDAMVDVQACASIYFELRKQGLCDV